ncbi:unnamed protein product [Rangifer tarandus platyrhynchus]|uniref:Uncharacterized protein n=2 Tax=Rangifer tarandus platyrhynchus TaxID=3082113 RepID=A0ABN8Y080_RANTA|nr:unnamed protein product [Rangifer tarandus platyrhynchus]CAI9692652.1 unnamed protein product [Rangifer tarandus platyrhynchus]
MRQERSSRCRALSLPAGGVRVEGPRNPSAYGTDAGAPRPASARTLVRSPAARGEGTPAERGGSSASDPTL